MKKSLTYHQKEYVADALEPFLKQVFITFLSTSSTTSQT